MPEGGADIGYIQAIHARTHPGAKSLRPANDGLPPPDLAGLALILLDA